MAITTRNRLVELNRVPSNCQSQTGIEFEVLVDDDASNDATDQMARDSSPHFRLIRRINRTGYIILRDQGFLDARNSSWDITAHETVMEK